MKNNHIAIVGGGQLGRMLIQEGLNYQIEFSVLDPDPNAPCAGIADSFEVGSLKDFDTVFNFGKDKKTLTIEIEHINVMALEKLEAIGVNVIPSPSILKIIQNKRLQKEFYKDNQIPTSDFICISNKQELEKHLDFLPAFQKSEMDGYDGKGVQYLKDGQDLSKCFDGPSILEKPVMVDKELSVIVSRDSKGNINCFPIVEMVFDPVLNLVDYLIAPADISIEHEKICKEIAIQVAKAFNLVGILAVELFLDKEGEILVNEVAPRAHNSGHHTIEACYTSQYEQQLRILMGLELGNSELIKPALMLNLIGAEGHEGHTDIVGLDEIDFNKTYLHLYGKKLTKPGRKMGHITILGDFKEELIQKYLQIKEKVKIVSKN